MLQSWRIRQKHWCFTFWDVTSHCQLQKAKSLKGVISMASVVEIIIQDFLVLLLLSDTLWPLTPP